MKIKPLTLLEDFHPFEVSLVKRGANQKKRFPIWKQQEIEMDKFDEILKSVLETELDEEEGKEFLAWVEKQKLSEKGVNAVKAALRILSGFKDELPGDALDKLASMAGYPAPAAKQVPPKKEEEEEEMKKKGPVAKALDDLPDDVKKHFEDVMKAQDLKVAALKKSNDVVTKALQEEKDIRELEAWTKKAETELSHYPGESIDEIAKSLKAMHDVDPKLAESQFKTMKAASDALKEGEIFKSAGSGFGGDGSADSAWAKIQKMADGLIEKSEDLSMSPAKAMARVLESPLGKELYSKYLDEQAAANRR